MIQGFAEAEDAVGQAGPRRTFLVFADVRNQFLLHRFVKITPDLGGDEIFFRPRGDQARFTMGDGFLKPPTSVAMTGFSK